ncbi:hypothetical protein AC1031_004239 [Aphanomyces cochlioides]|nr:hypothetical protein AC1031_004239 [Aphanomyces cochlioides]
MDAIRASFALPEVWCHISSFQAGIYQVVLPFYGVQEPPANPREFYDWLKPFQAKLDHYYAEYGTSQLHKLVGFHARMKYKLFVAAIAANDVSLLRSLHAKYNLRKSWRKLLDTAAICGNLEVLVYLHDVCHLGRSVYAMNLAAVCGDLNILKYLHANRLEDCTTGAMDGAAECGNLEILEWLHANRTEGCTSDAMDYAAQNGYLAVVQWLHDRGYPCSKLAMTLAIQRGHFKVVEWLHINRTEGCRPKSIDSSLTSHVSLDMISWLCVNRSDIDPIAIFQYGIVQCRSDVVDLLVDRFGIPWSNEIPENALRSGNMPVLHWIHDRSPDIFAAMGDNALKIAVWEENLSLVQWLCDDLGLDFSHHVLKAAAKWDRMDILSWLVDTERYDRRTVDYCLTYCKPGMDCGTGRGRARQYGWHPSFE